MLEYLLQKLCRPGITGALAAEHVALEGMERRKAMGWVAGKAKRQKVSFAAGLKVNIYA